MKQTIKKLLGNTLLQPLQKARFQLRSIPYRMGSQVECPTCGGTFKEFMPFRYRTNAQCPDCLSLERHRYIYLNLRDKQQIFDAPHKRVLHFAPDICMLKYFQNNVHIDYVTADYMTSFTPNITVMPDHVMSIDDITFESNSFDVIIAIGILVMVPDDAKAMREVLRVLKPGGYAVFHDPINYDLAKTFSDTSISVEERKKIYHGHDQRWYYGLDYGDRLRAQGFEVEDDNYTSEIDYKHYGVWLEEKVYIARKPL
jgi:SAM-dependent methyltransferase